MAKMTDDELLTIVNAAEADAESHNHDFMVANNHYLERYYCEPYGDEEEGRSSVVATDVQDTVESDMPSLARVFLGANQIMVFKPKTSNERDIEEAKQKTKYIDNIIRGQEESYKTQFGFLKTNDIEKTGVLKYFKDESETVREVTSSGLETTEWVTFIEDLKDQADEVEKIKVNGKEVKGDGPTLGKDDEATFRVTKTIKKFVVQGVPNENFLISRNATSKDSAHLVGDKGTITRGELIALGFNKEQVMALPVAPQNQPKNDGGIKNTRYQDQGGVAESSEIVHPINEFVAFSDLYILVDFDGDGILERRRIYKAGGKIFINELFPLVPYAISSAILMPYTVIGRSRAELATPGAWVKTVLERQQLDNIYAAGGRVVVNPKHTNLDDLSVIRHNGFVRTDDPAGPANAVSQLTMPFIGAEIQQIIQYQDFKRSNSLGNLQANQGLNADKFYDETATRFEGIEDAGTAKIELVARNIAETGYRQLYEGMAQLVSLQQDWEEEIMVLDVPMKVDPRKWRFEHRTESQVGLGAGDEEKILENMAVILNDQTQLKAAGSPLVDDTKMYNTRSKIVQSLGIQAVQQFYNNPDVPDQMLKAVNEKLFANNEQLVAAVEQLQGQNALAEAEKVKQEGVLIKNERDNALKEETLKVDTFNKAADREFDYVELETKEKTDIPGKGIGQ